MLEVYFAVDHTTSLFTRKQILQWLTTPGGNPCQQRNGLMPRKRKQAASQIRSVRLRLAGVAHGEGSVCSLLEQIMDQLPLEDDTPRARNVAKR